MLAQILIGEYIHDAAFLDSRRIIVPATRPWGDNELELVVVDCYSTSRSLSYVQYELIDEQTCDGEVAIFELPSIVPGTEYMHIHVEAGPCPAPEASRRSKLPFYLQADSRVLKVALTLRTDESLGGPTDTVMTFVVPACVPAILMRNRTYHDTVPITPSTTIRNRQEDLWCPGPVGA